MCHVDATILSNDLEVKEDHWTEDAKLQTQPGYSPVV